MMRKFLQEMRRGRAPVAKRPRLSVCIPTYNRAEYLERTLALHARLEGLGDCEIIVFNNASSDDTAAVVEAAAPAIANLRYFEQTHTVTAEENYVAACRHARGEFTIYLADDDELILPRVAAVIDYMERNPDVVACQAPWELFDNSEMKSYGRFYKLDEPKIFDRSTAIELCDLLLDGCIFPEIAIYRTDALQKILYVPRQAYPAHVFLARSLDYGSVAFLPEPFYRFITRHWKGESRGQLGNRQALMWDLYRGGMEYLLWKAHGEGASTGDEDVFPRYREKLDRFVTLRMQVALRMLIEAKDYRGASDVLARLLFRKGVHPEQAAAFWEFLRFRAPAEALLSIFDSSTTLRRLWLHGIQEPDELVTCIRAGRPALEVALLTSIEPGSAVEDALVLTHDADAREALLRAGFEPGLVIVKSELLAQFELQRPAGAMA